MIGVGASRVGKEGRVWGAAEEAILMMTNCDAIKQIELELAKTDFKISPKGCISFVLGRQPYWKDHLHFRCQAVCRDDVGCSST